MSKSERRGRKTVEKQAESLDESLGAGLGDGLDVGLNATGLADESAGQAGTRAGEGGGGVGTPPFQALPRALSSIRAVHSSCTSRIRRRATSRRPSTAWSRAWKTA